MKTIFRLLDSFLPEWEFDNLVSVMYPFPKYVFDISFFDSLSSLTEGHVGAIIDLMRIILADDVRRISFGLVII